MSGTLNGLLTQYAQAVKMRGATLVTLRRAQQTGGPNPLPMPPVCENPETVGVTAEGATSISIGAAAANGALVAGDVMQIAGQSYTVQSQVTSNSQTSRNIGFSNVPVSPAVPSQIPAGTPVTFSFSLDQQVYVNVNSYSQALIDGTVIQASDLRFTVAAWNLVSGSLILPPNQSDQIIFNGQQFAIVNTMPKIVMGNTVAYELQARA